MSQRYFLTAESTYEDLRQSLNVLLQYPNALGKSVFQTALYAPRDNFRRVLLAVDTALPGYATVNAAIQPLLDSDAMEEVDEATYLAAVASATGGGATFTTVTDTLTYSNFLPEAGSLADALSGIDSALGGKAAITDIRYKGEWSAGGYGQGDIVYKSVAAGSEVSGYIGTLWVCTDIATSDEPDGTTAAWTRFKAVAESHAHSATADLTFAGATAGQVLTVNSGATALVWATPTTYSLPDATNSVKGGVIVGSGLSVSSGTISVVTYAVRADTVSSTSYIGRAVSGSATSASVWTIRRTVLTSAGAVSATTTATNVKWDDRLTASYS